MTNAEAIEILKSRRMCTAYVDSEYVDSVDIKAIDMAIAALEKQEVRHGRWRQNDNGTWSCSECSSWIHDEQHYYARFCLHCGAKMDGGVNDETD